MSVQRLLTRLTLLNVDLHVKDRELKTSAPAGVLTPELIAEMKSHKEDLLSILQGRLAIEVSGLGYDQTLWAQAESARELAWVGDNTQYSLADLLNYSSLVANRIASQKPSDDVSIAFSADWQSLVLVLAALKQGLRVHVVPSALLDTETTVTPPLLDPHGLLLLTNDALPACESFSFDPRCRLILPAWPSKASFDNACLLKWSQQWCFSTGDYVVIDDIAYEPQAILEILSVLASGATLDMRSTPAADVIVSSRRTRLQTKVACLRLRGLDEEKSTFCDAAADEVWQLFANPCDHTPLYAAQYKKGLCKLVSYKSLKLLDSRQRATVAGESGELFVGDDDMQETGLNLRFADDGSLLTESKGSEYNSLFRNRVWPAIYARELLIASSWLHDAHLAVREDNNGVQKISAWVVPKADTVFADLEADIRGRWLVDRYLFIWPLDIIGVISLPLQVNGRVDENSLLRSPVIDNQQCERWAASMEGANVSSVAITAVQYEPEPRYTHFDEYMGEAWQPGKKNTSTSPIIIEDIKEQTQLALIETSPLCTEESGVRSLTEMLCAAAEQKGELTFIDHNGLQSSMTYADLLQSASRVAAGLQNAGVATGDTLILQVEDNAELLSAYWGCILAGVIALPQQLPRQLEAGDAEVRKLLNIRQRYGQPGILCSSNLAKPMRELIAESAKDQGVECCYDISKLMQYNSLLEAKVFDPDAPALMFTTSGSTGVPKAVLHPHKTVVAHAHAHAAHLELTNKDASLNWMPLTHVGGFIMFHLRDMLTGANQVHVDMRFVLADPLNWLRLLSEFRVSSTWAPNFAFALINDLADSLKDLDIDLSRLRSITNAGEQISTRTTRRFIQLLNPLGLMKNCMHPAWGMTETASAVIYQCPFDLETTSDSDAYVTLGTVIAGTSMRIVNDEGQILNEGVIGNLQVVGNTVTPGYYLNEAANDKAFTNDGWFITGDLGFISHSVLTLTGRVSDVIIINGINYPSQEIEAIVDELDAIEVSFTAACAVRMNGDNTDSLALFFVAEDRSDYQLRHCISTIQKRLIQTFGFSANYLIPLEKEKIPKTSLGKIQRSLLRKSLLAGEFDDFVKHADSVSGGNSSVPDWFYQRHWLLKHCKTRRLRTGFSKKVLVIASDDQAQLLAAAWQAVGIEPLGVSSSIFIQDENVGNKLNRNAVLKSVEAAILTDAALHIQFICVPPPEIDNSKDWRSEQAQLILNISVLLDVLQKVSSGMRVAVDIFTLGCVLVDERDVVAKSVVMPTSAGLDGLIKSAALENPALSIRHIDVDGEAFESGEFTKLALNEAFNPNIEAFIAWRKNRCYVPRLKAVKVPNQTNGELYTTEGVYLITGALGGIGFRLARWLQAGWQVRLLLPIRCDETKLNARQIDRLKELRGHGEVLVRELALADLMEIQGFVEHAEIKWQQPLAGVIHLAGSGSINDMIDDSRLIHRQTKASVNEMFAGKVYGAYTLHQLTIDKPKVQFICFSSVNAEFGGISFGLYSAANAFLHNLVLRRRAMGLASSWCLAWSSWREIGMSEGALQQVVSAASAFGYHLIDEGQGLVSMAAMIGNGPACSIIGLDARRQSIARYLTNQRVARYNGLVAQSDSHIQSNSLELKDCYGTSTTIKVLQVDNIPRLEGGAVNYTSLIQQLSMDVSGAEGDALETETEQQLASLWNELLGEVDFHADSGFFDLGGNSIKAGQLIYKIKDLFGVELPISVLFEAGTLRELAARISQSSPISSDQLALVVVDRGSNLPASFSQRRLWVLDRMLGPSAVYNVPLALRIRGPLDVKALHRSFEMLLTRHEALRTVFVDTDAGPMQKILDKVALPLEQVVGTAGEIEEFIATRSQQPFDLSVAPLLRLHLLKMPSQDYVLLINLHHIVSDGWSVGIMQFEFLNLYRAFSKGRESGLTPPEFQFVDYSEWLRKRLEGVMADKLESFWRNTLDGAPPLLPLITDFPRPAQQSYNGVVYDCQIPEPLLNRLQKYAKSHDSSLFMVLLTGFKAMLARYSRSKDIVVGTPVANRTESQLENIFGFFVNNIALRTRIDTDQSLHQNLLEVRQQTLAALEHALMPFDRILDIIDIPRNASYTPVFQVMFALQNAHEAATSFDALSIEAISSDTGTSRYDMTWSLMEDNQGMGVHIEYCRDLYQQESIERMFESMCTILSYVEEWSVVTANAIDLLVGSSGQGFVEKANRKTCAVANSGNIDQLFVAQVKATPNAVALIDDYTPEDSRQVSFSSLNQLVSRYANMLRGQGVLPGELVAVHMPRNTDLIAMVLAVLRIGAAYLPLDSEYPKARLAYMISDSNAKLLVAVDAPKLLLNTARQSIDPHKSGYDDYDKVAYTELLPPSAPSYVIYTSGSTGKPKGVLVPHSGLMALAAHMQAVYCIDQDSTLLMFGSVSFDVSIGELMGSIFSGATLRITQRDEVKSVESLTRIINDDNISHIILPPSLLALMTVEAFPQRHHFMVVGEACPVELARRWSSRHDFYNGYGPTEATVLTTVKIFKPNETTMTVGRVVGNLNVYIVNDNLQQQAVGAPGELCIAGEGLALGYIERPVLTAEKFVPNPFATSDGERLYRTGDLARYRDDGEIEYLGRLDHQVKISGHRIELGEIESSLNEHADVAHSAVVVNSVDDGPLRLLAYISASVNYEHKQLESNLRRDLVKQLPHYMVPHRFVFLEEMPMTDSGKVDRQNLPEPVFETSREVQNPQTEEEKVLLEVWQEVLHLEIISVDDNFFSLGGDSIVAIQIISRLKAKGYQLDARQIFEGQSIVGIATFMQVFEEDSQPEVFKPGAVPLTPVAYWFFELQLSNYSHWNQTLALDIGQPCYDSFFATIQAVIFAHDMLHSCYHKRNGAWQHLINARVQRPVAYIDISGLSTLDAENESTVIAEELQFALDIEVGRVHQPAIVHGRDRDLFLWILHHLVSDLVTLHMFKQDIDTVYKSLVSGEIAPAEIDTLLPRSASYRQWSSYLSERAENEPWLQNALLEWPQSQLVKPLLQRVIASQDHLNLSTVNKQLYVSTAHVSVLREKLKMVFNCDLDTAILMAVGAGLSILTELSVIPDIMLEGHGRDYHDIENQGPDISRTAGWFTRLYPVSMPQQSEGQGIQGQLVAVKEALALARRRAESYGVFRYLCHKPGIRARLGSLPDPQVSFNYLGEMSAESGSSKSRYAISNADILATNVQDPRGLRAFLIDVTAILIKGKLVIDFAYSSQSFEHEQIDNVIEQVKTKMQALYEVVSGQQQVVYSASDFPEAQLEDDDLAAVLSAIEDGSERD